MLLNAASVVTAAERAVTHGRIPIQTLLSAPTDDAACSPPPSLQPVLSEVVDDAVSSLVICTPAPPSPSESLTVVPSQVHPLSWHDNDNVSATTSAERRAAPRRRWKPHEDALLVLVVHKHGPGRWNRLAEQFPGRNGRQVRLRWVNHLQPSLDKCEWRPEEDHVLLAAHRALGNKWALIAMRLHGRTDNSVKNRFKSLARRAQREARARIR